MAAGADAVIGYVCQATLDPGDEIVTPWPSFPSYVLDPLKLAAVAVRVDARRDGRIDVDALLAAVTERTKLAFLPTVNNPTGTAITARRAAALRAGVPEHVLTVVDEAYFEYVDDPAFPDAIEEAVQAGARVLALRTFSKIYGLAGPADRLRRRPGARDRGDPQGAARVRRHDAGAGGRAREPRRRRPSSRAVADVNREAMAALAAVAPRARLRAARAGRRELPVRRRG